MIGLALEIPVAIGAFFFRDDLALEENLLNKKKKGERKTGKGGVRKASTMLQ